MSEFVSVLQSDALADGAGERVQVEDKDIALFRIGDKFYAIDNECPHSGGPLAYGFLDGETVMCPWHCWQFDLKNGECLTIAGFDVQCYPVRVENGTVQINPEQLNPRAE